VLKFQPYALSRATGVHDVWHEPFAQQIVPSPHAAAALQSCTMNGKEFALGLFAATIETGPVTGHVAGSELLPGTAAVIDPEDHCPYTDASRVCVPDAFAENFTAFCGAAPGPEPNPSPKTMTFVPAGPLSGWIAHRPGPGSPETTENATRLLVRAGDAVSISTA
jgi:hypothetical protein